MNTEPKFENGRGLAPCVGLLAAMVGANLSWLISKAMFIGNHGGQIDFDSSLDATLLLFLCYPTGFVIGFLAGFYGVCLAKRNIAEKTWLPLMVLNVALSIFCAFIFCRLLTPNESWSRNFFLFQTLASFVLLALVLFFLPRARRA